MIMSRIAVLLAALTLSLGASAGQQSRGSPQSQPSSQGQRAERASEPDPPVPAAGKTKSGVPTSEGQKSASTSTPDPDPAASPKLDIFDAATVNTDAAVHRVAEQMAGKASDKDQKKSEPSASAKNVKSAQPDVKTAAPADPAVTEFQPRGPGEAGASDPVMTSAKQSKKRVHGDVHGSAGGNRMGANGGGGSVGATSKSGSTSVYIGADHVGTSVAPPR